MRKYSWLIVGDANDSPPILLFVALAIFLVGLLLILDRAFSYR